MQNLNFSQVKALLLVFITLASSLEAHGEKSAFEKALEDSTMVRPNESIVLVGDIKYRKIEYKGQTFYLRLLENDPTQISVTCGIAGELPLGLETSKDTVKDKKIYYDFLSKGLGFSGNF